MLVDRRPLPRRLFAEFLGSAFLAATVIGSGIIRALYPNITPGEAAEIMVPHEADEDGKVIAPS